MAEFKNVLKHSGNYLIANLATKALAFISIPVYTRLLSTHDFGVYSIFIGVVGILASLMAFSADRSVSRYFFDQKNENDFKQFVGTSTILAFVFFFINSILLIIFADEFGGLVGLNKKVVYLIIPVSLINIVGLTFQQIYGPLKESKTIAKSSLFQVYIGFAFSILFILLYKTDKYYGQIIGQLLAGLLMVYYWIKKIKPYFIITINNSYVKYIFTYSIPLIPYALSGVIIEQFSKIAIGNDQSISQAGYYSLALSISSLVSLAIGITDQAWSPYYMEYMNKKKYSQIDSDFSKIFRLTLFAALGISAFGKEIGMLLAKKDFSASLHLIPIFTIGYVFYQFAYIYLRNFGYSKKTHFMTLTVFISGFSNILMNLILIPKYHELGAAISFVISYIIMAITGFIFNKYFVKLHAIPLKNMIVPIIVIIPFYIVLYFLTSIDSLFLLIIFKIILTCLFTTILFWKDRNEIEGYFKNILVKR